MSAFNWVKRLRSCESGNVIFIAAATMPMVMGAAGLAVDTVQMALWKRQVQRAADSAALAGGHAWAQGASKEAADANDVSEHVDFDIAKHEAPPFVEKLIEPGSYAEGIISAGELCAERADVGPDTRCYDRAVRVYLRAERKLPFINIFKAAPSSIDAHGTAAITEGGEHCMIALHKGDSPGIIAGGNAKLTLGCGAATNARAATDSIKIFGTAKITASPLSAVGGIEPGKNSYSSQVLNPFSSEVSDPYQDVAEPEAPLSCTEDLNVGKDGLAAPLPATSNCFVNWKVDGPLELTSNTTYFVNGGQLDLSGKISGTNVTIVLLGNESSIKQNGGGVLAITAPTSGNLSGIALYRTRAAVPTRGKEIKLNGGADMAIKGAIYMPTTDIWIGGNADIKAKCIQVIGRVIEFKGGGTIKNECDDTGIKKAHDPVVRLVS